MISFRQTNSWHWLLLATLGCLPLAGYLSLQVWKNASEKIAPELEAMKSHSDELKLLQEEDVSLLEHQTSDLRKRLTAYEAIVNEKAGNPIPEGEQSVRALRNEIDRALHQHDLRIIIQEQEQVVTPQPNPTPVSVSSRARPEVQAAARAAARNAVTREAEQAAPSLPFNTQEIRYVVEGEYRHMFMFLVRQSHRKPSYHFKDIRIITSPEQFGMRMEFTVQIHFT